MAENLWAISIDPDESMREYVLLQLKVKAMRDLLFRSRIFNYLAAATPGLKELVTIGKIWELALDDRKVTRRQPLRPGDRRRPATGHGVGFLQTPRTFANIARVGPIRQQAETLDGFIRDRERTGVAVVALPEEMPVNETATLERDLADRGRRRRSTGSSATASTRSASTDAEVERIAAAAPDAGPAARAACRAALTEARRAPRPARAARAPRARDCKAPGEHAAVPVRARARRRGDRRAAEQVIGLMAGGRRAARGQARSASAPAPAGSARRRPRRRSPPGWRRAARRSRC